MPPEALGRDERGLVRAGKDWNRGLITRSLKAGLSKWLPPGLSTQLTSRQELQRRKLDILPSSCRGKCEDVTRGLYQI